MAISVFLQIDSVHSNNLPIPGQEVAYVFPVEFGSTKATPMYQ